MSNLPRYINSLTEESFAHTTQIVLSCSHLYHSSCLLTFERLSTAKIRTCPVCRCQKYSRLRTTDASKIAIERAAIMIQKTWKGYLESKKFSKHIPINPKLANRRLIKNLDCARVEMESMLKNGRNEVQNLLSNLDINHQQVERMLGGMHRKNGWNKVIEKCKGRGKQECPICLCEVKLENGGALLSCSHILHGQCYRSYIEFVDGTRICPICRLNDFKVKQMGHYITYKELV